MPSERYFVDTNIFLYTLERENDRRRLVAREVLDRLVRAGTGIISTQVLGESFNTLTTKERFRVGVPQAAAFVRALAATWRVLPMTDAVILEAIKGVERHKLSYYDAQLWAVARLNGIPVLLSEDGHADRNLDGVTFRNPLLEGFELDQLGPAVS